MKYSLAMLMLLVGATSGQDWNAYAQGWIGSGQYYDGSNREQYYPYFGEDFFNSGYNPYESSPEAIEARRTRFEAPFLPYFGDLFLSQGEPYRFAYPGPWVDYSLYPYGYYDYPSGNRPVTGWPAFQKNWTSTINFARSSSSFKVFSGGAWTTA